MKLPIALLSLPLVLATSGCVASIGNRASDKPGAEGAKGGDPEDAADKLEKKQRELDYAKMELDIAKMSAAADARESDASVQEATQKLEVVKKDRDNFKALEKPSKLADKQLDIDRAAWRMEETRQELAELEQMYKKEDFASLTKELVLNRGKKNLEFAQRGLDLAKKEQDGLTTHDLPKRETELDQSVERAEKALAEATAKKEKGAAETKLKLLRAEHRVAEAQRELDKAHAKEKAPDKEPKA
jgi:hypothetical protein